MAAAFSTISARRRSGFLEGTHAVPLYFLLEARLFHGFGNQVHGPAQGGFEALAQLSLHVLAYNMKRVMNILGVPGLLQAMRAYAPKGSLLFIFACAAALIAALSAVFCARKARFQPG